MSQKSFEKAAKKPQHESLLGEISTYFINKNMFGDDLFGESLWSENLQVYQKNILNQSNSLIISKTYFAPY